MEWDTRTRLRHVLGLIVNPYLGIKGRIKMYQIVIFEYRKGKYHIHPPRCHMPNLTSMIHFSIFSSRYPTKKYLRGPIKKRNM